MSKTAITIVTAIVVAIVTIILQRSFSNIISGINLALRKPFKKGDRITLKYYDREIVSGHIMDLKLTKIKIKTYDKSIYILPTNIVDSCVIINEDLDKGINHTEKIKFSLDSNIAKAKANFDSLAEGIDDYYTLTDKARGLVDTALEDKNTGGNGSKTFWKTYQGLASEEAFNKHDLDEAISDMKQFQKYFAEGADGATAFTQKLVDSQDKAFKFTEANGEETIKHVSDFFKLADDGTLQITKDFKNLSDEQYSQLAAAFKLSDDSFTAILNNLRQWGDIDFADPGLIRKALATDARSVTTNKKVSVEGEDEKVSRLYYGESTLRAETAEKTDTERKGLVKDLEVQGSIQLPSGADALIQAPITVEGKDTGGLLKQFVADTKGTGNQMQNVMASLIKSGEYNKEDLEKIHQ